MYRKLAIISVLAIGLILLLIFKPWESEDVKNPRFFDRLPDSEIIGKANLLELTDLLSKNLYYYNSPLREFISSDFVLSQGKNYGLDIQSPVYFFMDKGSKDYDFDLGIMIQVKDSTKLGDGLKRIRNVISYKDTLIEGYRFIVNNKSKLYVAYGKDWLLFYMGRNGSSYFRHILNAGRNEITPTWRNFISNPSYAKLNFVAETSSRRLRNRGIKSASVTLSNDSTSISFHTVLNPFDSVSFSLKNSGVQLEEQEFTKTLVNIHVDASGVKRNKRDPVYSLLKELGAKISFPVDEFLDAWDGNLAARQGGIHTIQETYIESELDDDFNVMEVVKTQNVKVPGMSIFFSVNDNGKTFVRKLFSKGILTLDGSKQRLLYSPPMNLKTSSNSYLYYTANYKPNLIPSTQNYVLWSFEKLPVSFYLDSVKPKQIYGRIQLPVKPLLEQLITERK